VRLVRLAERPNEVTHGLSVRRIPAAARFRASMAPPRGSISIGILTSGLLLIVCEMKD